MASWRNFLSKHAILLVLTALGLSLAGCSGDAAATPAAPDSPPTPTRIRKTKAPTATAAAFVLITSSPSLTPTALQTTPTTSFGFGPDNFPPNINPLTGQTVPDPDILDRRPMVIKITNFPRGTRPQWGLTLADHVYEYYLEDELTRFIGIYYGNDANRVGPIRSARPFDEQIIRAYKGIFAFAYADDRLIEFWEDTDIEKFLFFEGPDNCPPMCRIGSENDYNTLYTDTRELMVYSQDRSFSHGRQDLKGLRFEPETMVTFGGGKASQLEIRYSPSSYNYWEYDPVTLRYYRWQDADRRAEGDEIYEPLFDSLTAQQVHADNLIVLMAPIAYFFKSNSTEIYDIQLIGQGEAFALREGKIFGVQWQRPHKDSLLTITFPNGTPFPLRPGNTWFQMLSTASTHQVSDQTWRFKFIIPEDLPAPTKTPKPKKTNP